MRSYLRVYMKFLLKERVVLLWYHLERVAEVCIGEVTVFG